MLDRERSGEAFVAGDLRIEQTAKDGAIVLSFRGRSNDRSPARTLAPFIRSVYERATKDKSKVEMHFEHLEHFNSSTITALIQFIQEARAKGIALEVVYDASLKWQKLSFDALVVFKHDLLTLRTTS